jgi:uncharacterized protein
MLQNTFCHIPGIGLKTEQDLWARHVHSWDDVMNGAEVYVRGRNKEFIRNYILSSLEHLQLRDADYFAKGLPTAEAWRLYGEFKHSTAFIDIETASGGGSGNYITTISLYDGATVHYYVHGHNLGKFVEDIQRYRVIVTFNGKGFDIPVIEKTFKIKMTRAHIDLRHVLSGLGYKGGLKVCEKELGLNRKELDGVDGYYAVLLWKDYVRNGNPRALDTLLAYNVLDAVNLEPLMITAYNLKLKETPFRDDLQLPIPPPPRNPFSPDIETLDRIRTFIEEH